MDRNELIQQVKAEYARLAEAQTEMTDYRAKPGDAYFEELLNKVIRAIESGRFDGFQSGHDIVEAVANDHGRWNITM